MKALNIINRYIFREFLSPFVISLFFLTFVFLMTRIPEITNMVVNYNAGLLSVVLMVGYTLPKFLEFTIPMAVMISVLLTFMRMAGDNEIIALKGAGISLYKLLPPVLAFCLSGVLLSLCVTIFGVPWGKLALKKKGIEIVQSNIDMAIQERQFNSKIENVMIYVSHVDMNTKSMKDVFIEDRRTRGVVSICVAPSGTLIRSEDGLTYTIRLYDGLINQVDTDKKSVNYIRFGTYDISIDLNTMNKGSSTISKDLDEIGLGELLGLIRSGIKDKARLSEALMELHEKFSIPFACLCLGLLAFPLGIQSSSLRRSSGFGLGMSFFFLYYFLLAAGWSAGETGDYPPLIGMWLPNVLMGGIGIFFLVRNAREKPVRFPYFMEKLAVSIKKKVMRKQ